MNEADRCDRISLMHAGKVLAVGAPQELVKERGSASLEDCFVGYLAEAAGIDMSKKVEAPVLGRRRSRGGRAAEALQNWPAMGLRAARDGRALARSDPAGFRARRPHHSHVRLRLRHLVRHREPGDRVIRPGRHAREPRPASGLRRLALFLGPAADHVGGRGRETAQKREHPDRRRSPARLRPRPSQQAHAGSRCDGRRRHDLPRRDGEELRDRRHQEAGRGIARSQRRAGQRKCLDGRRYPDPLSLQSGLSQRECDGAQHFHAAALPDPGDHVGDRGRAGEGDGLDRQLPLDADHPISST